MRGTAWKRIERRVLSLITSQDGQERETQERMLLRRAGRSVGGGVARKRLVCWIETNISAMFCQRQPSPRSISLSSIIVASSLVSTNFICSFTIVTSFTFSCCFSVSSSSYSSLFSHLFCPFSVRPLRSLIFFHDLVFEHFVLFFLLSFFLPSFLLLLCISLYSSFSLCLCFESVSVRGAHCLRVSLLFSLPTLVSGKALSQTKPRQDRIVSEG